MSSGCIARGIAEAHAHVHCQQALIPAMALMPDVVSRYISEVDLLQISASAQLSPRGHSSTIRITSYIDISPLCYITVPYTSRNVFICHLLLSVALLPRLMLMCTVNKPSRQLWLSCQLWLGRYTSEVDTFQISASVQISTREHNNIIHST